MIYKVNGSLAEWKNIHISIETASTSWTFRIYSNTVIHNALKLPLASKGRWDAIVLDLGLLLGHQKQRGYLQEKEAQLFGAAFHSRQHPWQLYCTTLLEPKGEDGTRN